MQTEHESSFASLGISEPLVDAVAKMGFNNPTDIQQKCIPEALKGRDIIGLAPTGSGKTAAFALPILQRLWDNPQGFVAVVLAPSRELAYQISSQFEALGAGIGVRCLVLTGGDSDKVAQAAALMEKPHILVATPGRIVDHLRSTKGFRHLRAVKVLVMDEADRLLDLDFTREIDELLKAIPRDRTTYLFSATMNTKVSKLQRASLTNPVRVETSSTYHTVDTLKQYYILAPLVHKELTVVYLANSSSAQSIIIFTRNVHGAWRLALILKALGFSVVSLHGGLTQSQRLGALSKFKGGSRSILVAIDVASRGLDIPRVDVVINFDMPTHSKDYIHRVGRTARAGRAGKAISIVTQYDVEIMLRLEKVLEKKLDLWPTDKEEMMLMFQRVDEAGRAAESHLRDEDAHGRGKRRKGVAAEDNRDRDDDEVEAGMPNIKKKRRI